MTKELSDAQIYAINEVSVKAEEIRVMLESILNRPSLKIDLDWIEKAINSFDNGFDALVYSIEKTNQS